MRCAAEEEDFRRSDAYRRFQLAPRVRARKVSAVTVHFVVGRFEG